MMASVVSSGLILGCAFMTPQIDVSMKLFCFEITLFKKVSFKANGNDMEKNENQEIQQKCWVNICNFSLLKKPEFTVLFISSTVYSLGVYTVYGFTFVSLRTL
jgi:hypothetical protein